jgi:two-component system, NarL family, response regulator DegU
MKKIRIAVADDHLLFRKGIVSLLQMSDDFDLVLEASNGQELLDGLAEAKPEIVLMDLQMPVLDGIRTTQYLKEHNPEIKIIVVSMHDEAQFVTHLMELGANGYLLKDTDPDEVEKAIRTVAKEDYYYGTFLVKIMHSRISKKPMIKETIAAKLLIDADFSERELEVLKLICEGLTNNEIGQKIFLSTRTVEGYRDRLMAKTATKNTAGLVAYAVRKGIC